jgi:hypothetical protein
MNSMVSQQIVNTGTVEGVADYEIGNVPCTGSLAHADDDDNDRIEPSPAFCMHFRLSYSTLHANVNAHLHRKPCNLSHVTSPRPILVFHSHVAI